MPKLTFLNRVVDGLPLAASSDTASDGALTEYKTQAKQLLRKLNSRSPARMTIDSGPYTFHYIIEDNVCYLTLCDRDYPKRLAFAFLNDVHQGFQEELKKESGDAWRDSIETADRPYKFIKFDKFIQRQRKAYSDPSSGPNTARLNDDLLDIHAIMKKNIQEVLNRGEQLDHVSGIANRLAKESDQFRWGAKKLNTMEWLKKHLPWIAALLIILLVVWLRFF